MVAAYYWMDDVVVLEASSSVCKLCMCFYILAIDAMRQLLINYIFGHNNNIQNSLLK